MKKLLSIILALLLLTACNSREVVSEKALANGTEITVTVDRVPPTPKPTPIPTPVPTFSVSAVSMSATPNSSCFSEVGYDADFDVLVVVFRESGSKYTYSNFPQSAWDEFIAASSLGSHYNKCIKGLYDCERIY